MTGGVDAPDSLLIDEEAEARCVGGRACVLGGGVEDDGDCYEGIFSS
jgi:hypothetical protein